MLLHSVTDDTNANINGAVGSSQEFIGNVTRRRATLYDQNQTASIFARNWVKSHTGESVTVRRQFTTEISGGQFSITTGANGVFGR